MKDNYEVVLFDKDWEETDPVKIAAQKKALIKVDEEFQRHVQCARRSLGSESYNLVATRLAKRHYAISSKFKGENVSVDFSFLGGGILFGLYPSDITDFLRAYGHDLAYDNWKERKTKLGVIEMWRDRFRFYIDADFLLEVEDHERVHTGNWEGVRPFFMKRVYQVIQSVMNRVFPNLDEEQKNKMEGANSEEIEVCRQNMLRLIVASTPPRLFNKKDKLHVKHGFHLHWPGISVTQDIALALRQAIVLELSASKAIAELTAQFKYKFDWKDIIDEKPYLEGKSLRLVGSCKTQKCPMAGDKKDTKCLPTCLVCEGKTNMYTEPYRVSKIVTYNGSYDTNFYLTLEDKFQKIVELLSISHKQGDPEPDPDRNVLKSQYNVSFTLGIGGIRNVNRDKIQRVKQTKASQIEKDIMTQSEFQSSEDVPPEMEVAIASLCKHVEQSYCFDCPPWKVKKVRRGWKQIDQGTKDAVYYLFTNCHFCMNIGGSHNSKTVYFEATIQGISQRCSCKCDTMDGRSYGRCCDYRSARDVNIPPDLLDSLFITIGTGLHITTMDTHSLLVMRSLQKIMAWKMNTYKIITAQKKMREEKKKRKLNSLTFSEPLETEPMEKYHKP
jgi:hypothetical protein